MAPSRIVVIDDDPGIRALMQELLAGAGYAPKVFADGAEALAAVRADPPDLVILDHVMAPVDGLAVHGALQADPLLRPIPVLFLTGSPQDVPPLPGVMAVVGKPFRLGALVDTLRSLLSQGSAG